jgi:hypothetical protein
VICPRRGFELGKLAELGRDAHCQLVVIQPQRPYVALPLLHVAAVVEAAIVTVITANFEKY